MKAIIASIAGILCGTLLSVVLYLMVEGSETAALVFVYVFIPIFIGATVGMVLQSVVDTYLLFSKQKNLD